MVHPSQSPLDLALGLLRRESLDFILHGGQEINHLRLDHRSQLQNVNTVRNDLVYQSYNIPLIPPVSLVRLKMGRTLKQTFWEKEELVTHDLLTL